MSVFIRRKKMLLEDDNNTSQDNNAQQQQQGQQNQQNQQNQSNTSTDDSQTAQKVMDVLKNLKNVYWSIGNDVVGYIKNELPEFNATNDKAKDAIAAWDEFKKNPSSEAYSKFLNAFGDFGAKYLNTDDKNATQQAVDANQQALKDSMTFASKLKARMDEAKVMKRYEYDLKVGYESMLK